MSALQTTNTRRNDSGAGPTALVGLPALDGTQLPAALVDRLLAGAQIGGAGSEHRTVLAPFTGKPLLELPTSAPSDVDRAYAVARKAQPDWAAMPVRERAAIFRRLHDLILDDREQLADLLQTETGKARYDAFAEVLGAAVATGYYGRVAGRLLAPVRRGGLVPLLTTAFEMRQPVGVVGMSAAWNFPVVFAAYDGAPALLAGNALVHRPDSQATLCVLRVRELAIEAGLPPEVWQIVIGPGSTIGTEVLERGDAVVFTGSTEVGRQIAERAGRRLVSASLELGGKNALLVLADADLDRAAAGAVRATFTNTGQACVGTERILVAEEVADDFTERLVAVVSALRVGAGLTFAYDVGPLANQAQLDRVREHVEDAVAQGARVLTGGVAMPDVGPYCYAPTVISDVRRGMLCREEETFGPVVSVERFSSVDEAVAMANDTAYGLAAGIWTRNTKAALRLAARLRAGSVDINDSYFASWGSVAIPQGGMGDSGVGRRNGPQGLLRFTEAQGVTVHSLHGIHPPRGVSKELFVEALAVGLRILNKTRLR